jgi:protein-tyrosine phosphatase
MTPSIFPISAKYPGQLFIMPKPSAEGLEACIRHYRSMGATIIISMLDRAEIEELSLQREGDICSDNQLEFIHFPIPDFGLPERESFKVLVRDVTSRLRDNAGVAIHCRAGIGRSGMLACCTLAGFFGSADTAIETVSQARGVEVPDTPAQRAFIADIAQDLME